MAKNIKIWKVFAMKKLVCFTLVIGLCFAGTATITTTLSSGFGSYCERTMVIKSDGSLWMWGGFVTPFIDPKYGGMNTGYRNSPVKIMDDVICVSCGDDYTATVKKDGTLWTWGDNQYAQLGNGEKSDRNAVIDKSKDKHTPQKIMDGVSVCCADSYSTAVSFAIKSDGSLWRWGWTDTVPYEVTDNASFVSPGFVIKTDGSLWSIDDLSSKIMDNVCAVAGTSATFAITNDGDLYG